MTLELTTLADDMAVLHDGLAVTHVHDLLPETRYEVAGVSFTTLPRPEGELLCRFTTVNDVHFGEVEAGRVGDHPEGPIQRVRPDEPPYPEVMNRGAVAEMAAIDPTVVVVKGDLSQDGTPEEWEAFERCYRSAFGDRLHVVRGNHDAYRGQTGYAGDQWIRVPGLAIALVDTVIPEHTTGRLLPEQLDWLETLSAESDVPVLVMGHHQQWIAGEVDSHRSEGYFGLHPDASDGLDAVAARQRSIIGYTAGHTHRHRVRRMTTSGVPSIEIGCVKDFPGTWAEYRVYETGVMQVVHRISDPAALAWSERCRHLYADFGVDYESYALGTLEERCCNIPLR